MKFKGEAVLHGVFDLGGTLDLVKARAALGAMLVEETIATTRAQPEYANFARPLPLDLSALGLELRAEDDTPLAVHARLYEAGAIALMLRFRAEEDTLAAFARYQQLDAFVRGERKRRVELFRIIVNAVKQLLSDAYEDAFDVDIDPEKYVSYCLTEAPGGAAALRRDGRAGVAALITAENRPEKLSAQQIEEVTRIAFSYYDDDLAVLHWDAALVIEPNAAYEDLLYVIEVANLQLLMLRKYDRYLDIRLERGYADFERLHRRLPLLYGRQRDMVRELAEVRMDMAKTTDELENTAKFFGDWYVARVYMGMAQRLHLGDYEKSVDEKLETLNTLYQSVLSETQTRQNLVLEWAIVILILLEVVMAFVR
ncbi:MAG TPA: hypothetical protein PKX48_10455 [Planctomycetota bacterium]|jgi:hypothetical protein|nr:hypothetical protein [Planctomycetota bacterium]OQC21732.1 MAG: hypothetical protein BWX69_00662 [Planctomycetes bacterium ADurb.Bin069]NMD34350.1 hypothetical protein [Planctomycetota bacterium]HNR98888.1 hypothetical protein [Planctomycetota bacterium]HNU26037.1 hypothetical protein [Planctomycetota bacterium]